MAYYLIMNLHAEGDFRNKENTQPLADISYGLTDCLYLGNLNAKRDWGHAIDFVEMQWLCSAGSSKGFCNRYWGTNTQLEIL